MVSAGVKPSVLGGSMSSDVEFLGGLRGGVAEKPGPLTAGFRTLAAERPAEACAATPSSTTRSETSSPNVLRRTFLMPPI